ncbi:methyltransferase [Acrasis kona]|uniref:Methyltransferase n=1 Tax=Acrasis kona TaxID=1008807 RepID=A0AAW2ZS37_9EUKA
MSKQIKYDLFKNPGQVEAYAKYRPQYPTEIFDSIKKYHNKNDDATVADVACGSGQATIELAKHFKNVIGIEPSRPQLDNAPKQDNIKYVHASAEATSLSDSSVDIVTVAQAFHWFDFEKFYAEVRRITRPDGTLAVWTYALNHFDNKEAQDALLHLYNVDLSGNWSERRKLVDDNYKSIVFPFQNKTEVVVNYKKTMSIRNYVNYLSSWSSIQDYNQKNPNNTLLKDFELKLKTIYKADDTESFEVEVVWPMYLLLMKIN